MSAYFQRPLELGADIEFASVTKYYNGHSDVLMGMTALRDESLAERLQFIQFAAGAVPGPFDCYMANRGLKTLHLRMEAHAKNAMAVAMYLDAHPKVTAVLYPGLPSHPNHEVAKAQSTGFSGMVSFRIRGDIKASTTFLQKVHVFTLAESLGAVESLAELPAVMTHASVPAEQRAALGITDSLIRLSVGVENTIDLLRDLEQALDAAVPGRDATPNVNDFANLQASHRGGAGAAAAAPAPVAASTYKVAAAAAVSARPETAPAVSTASPVRAGLSTREHDTHPTGVRRVRNHNASSIFGDDSAPAQRPVSRSQCNFPGGASTFIFG
jgi:cystathionine gamma-lyase